MINTIALREQSAGIMSFGYQVKAGDSFNDAQFRIFIIEIDTRQYMENVLVLGSIILYHNNLPENGLSCTFTGNGATEDIAIQEGLKNWLNFDYSLIKKYCELEKNGSMGLANTGSKNYFHGYSKGLNWSCLNGDIFHTGPSTESESTAAKYDLLSPLKAHIPELLRNHSDPVILRINFVKTRDSFCCVNITSNGQSWIKGQQALYSYAVELGTVEQDISIQQSMLCYIEGQSSEKENEIVQMGNSAEWWKFWKHYRP